MTQTVTEANGSLKASAAAGGATTAKSAGAAPEHQAIRGRRSVSLQGAAAQKLADAKSAAPKAVAARSTGNSPSPTPPEEVVRRVMGVLAETYHGRGSVELGDPFKILVATVISQRTREEQTTAVSNRVFARYPDATSLAASREDELYELLEGSQYRETKAPRLIALAQNLLDRFGGRVPDDIEDLLTLPGVGRKTANCLLIYGYNKPALCVDIHMHRISNRLGWVRTSSPEQTEQALERVMPRDLWIGSNRLFLQHGRATCVPSIPYCSRCPVRTWCKYGQSAGELKR